MECEQLMKPTWAFRRFIDPSRLYSNLNNTLASLFVSSELASSIFLFFLLDILDLLCFTKKLICLRD